MVKKFAASAALIAPLVATAMPTLIGDTVTANAKLSTFSSVLTQTGVVGTDTFSLMAGVTAFKPTFTANTVNIGFNTTFGTGGWYFDVGFFEITGIDALIQSVALSASSSVGDVVSSDVSFTDHSVRLNLDNSLLYNWDSYVLTLTLAEPIADVTSVPEPASLALVGLALLGFAAARKRKQA